jgi:hypothetical protein
LQHFDATYAYTLLAEVNCTGEYQYGNDLFNRRVPAFRPFLLDGPAAGTVVEPGSKLVLVHKSPRRGKHVSSFGNHF